MLGVMILLNNWFHDLSVALLTCALLGAAAIWRGALETGPGAAAIAGRLDRLARRIGAWSLAGVVVFGAVRTWAFMEYEWIPAAGKGLLPALAVKHVVLVSLLGGATVAALRARRRGRAATGASG